MGRGYTSSSGVSKKKKMDPTTSSSPSSSSSSLSTSSDSDSQKHRRHRRREGRRRSRRSSRKEKGESRKKREKRDRDRDRERKRRRKDDKRRSKSERKRRHSDDDDDDSEPETSRSMLPQAIVEDLLQAYPNVATDLQQLLKMLDDGQAVDIRGLSERSLVKYLKKLFVSLNLKEDGDGVFLLPPNSSPTLEAVGSIICSRVDPNIKKHDDPASVTDTHLDPPEAVSRQVNDGNLDLQSPKDENSAPKRRIMGPEMPSAELLAAAAKLTEAQTEMREAELEEDTEIFIGPPPPAIVSEAESANEAERFEEVTRIMGVEANSPYDVLGVNHKMSVDNVKKRYWKLSLMVHPDKCSHPQAHQAFIVLNKAFKELQDPAKREALDEKIKLKEEEEAFKAELRSMREAAQWRRLQGISMEGDDELLAETNTKMAPERDEWMTTLPPERKPGGMPTQTTQFSRSSKEGRGDTSIWTDTPLDKAQKAKMNYLEAYNEAAALASNEEEKKRTSSDADLVEKYNKAKRSKTLVQKHQEEAVSRSKRKSKQQSEKEEWASQHPWKPWDREKDLVAGRQSVKLDSDNMAQGLTSRFSSGTFQRNFL